MILGSEILLAELEDQEQQYRVLAVILKDERFVQYVPKRKQRE